MVEEKLKFNEQAFSGNQEDYDAIREAINKLSTTSQDQFETIKKEKWYNRLFDMVTFSQKGKKRLAEQIGTVAQAQQILIELLLRLSNIDSNISDIVAESQENIRKIQVQNIFLFEKIKQLEDSALGIRKDTDISTLTERSKEILSACLYHLSNTYTDSTDNQKLFANAVLDYLGCETQMENVFGALEGMSIDEKKKVLTCCMEYMFLKKLEDNYDEYTDFIDEFDIGNKTLDKISEQIKALFKLRGIDGFIGKYQKAAYEKLSDSFMVEFDDGIEAETATEDDDLDNNTDEIIKKVIEIGEGEQLEYKNKNIHIKGKILCNGKLVFDHCNIYCDGGQRIFGANFSGESAGIMVITKSNIIGQSFDSENYFVARVPDTDHIERYFASIEITECTFTKCCHFIDGIINDVIISNCKISNCIGLFKIRVEETCNVDNNYVCLAEIPDNINSILSQTQYERWNIFDLDGNSLELCHFTNNNFEMGNRNIDNVNNIHCLFGSQIEVSNCSVNNWQCAAFLAQSVKESLFKNCKGCIDFMGTGELYVVDDCIFDHCSSVISEHTSSTITNCQFVSCSGDLITCDCHVDGGVVVDSCSFTNIVDDREEGEYERNACLSFKRSPDGYINTVKNCKFDGVDLNEGFLIIPYILKNPNGFVTSISHCKFNHCKTNRDSKVIVSQYDSYWGGFLGNKKIQVQCNDIEDCTGLDKVVNKGKSQADSVSIRTDALSGRKIGAVIS